MGHCSGSDALYLVSALSNALARGGDTPELGRAARTWGARFSAPVEALAAISQLREALLSLPPAPGAEGEGSPQLARVFDQVMMEAVDAASSNLRSAALLDPLTGCANRRAFDEEVARSLVNSRRSGLELSLVVVDLDGLKAINDSGGHASGDAALVSLVTTLRRVLRGADSLYRTGGDEFVVVTPFTDAAGARSLMQRAERMGGPSFSWGVASASALSGAAGQHRGAVRVVGRTAEAEIGPVTLLAAADADLYARRVARRRDNMRRRRKHRAIVLASAAASVVVASGVALGSTLGGGPPAKTGTGTAALPAGTGGAGKEPVNPRALGHASAPATGSSPSQPATAAAGSSASPPTTTAAAAASSPSGPVVVPGPVTWGSTTFSGPVEIPSHTP